jgi:hypothetical protein
VTRRRGSTSAERHLLAGIRAVAGSRSCRPRCCRSIANNTREHDWGGCAARKPQSVRLTAVAWTRASSSSASGTGRGASVTWTTSGGPMRVATARTRSSAFELPSDAGTEDCHRPALPSCMRRLTAGEPVRAALARSMAARPSSVMSPNSVIRAARSRFTRLQVLRGRLGVDRDSGSAGCASRRAGSRRGPHSMRSRTGTALDGPSGGPGAGRRTDGTGHRPHPRGVGQRRRGARPSRGARRAGPDRCGARVALRREHSVSVTAERVRGPNSDSLRRSRLSPSPPRGGSCALPGPGTSRAVRRRRAGWAQIDGNGVASPVRSVATDRGLRPDPDLPKRVPARCAGDIVERDGQSSARRRSRNRRSAPSSVSWRARR